MIFEEKSAVGIDISQDRISIVLLKNGKDGPELVKSAVVPVPQGAVKDGNIADPALLAKTIRDLRFHNRIWTRQAAVSLFARPVVAQILDMPEQMPSNIRQFVSNEVKNCVVLPSRDITFDFCGIGFARRAAERKVLAVAAESTRMAGLVRLCSRAGFRAELIEPPLVAYLRAIGRQKVTGRSGMNVLVALLRGTVLTLCVLKNGAVDFIRTKEMATRLGEGAAEAKEGIDTPNTSSAIERIETLASAQRVEAGPSRSREGTRDSEDLNCWLADELAEVVKFYDIEVSGNAGKWEITIFVDSTLRQSSVQASSPQVDAAQSAQAVEECLKSRVEAGHLQVRTIEDAYMDTPVAGSAEGRKEKPSPVAVGLAMRLLAAQGDDVRINLVPREIEQLRAAQKDALMAANVVAAILLIMVLAVSGFTAMFGKVCRDAAAKKLLITKQDTDSMLEQHQRLDAKLQVLSGRLGRISQISALQHDVNWADLLGEIRMATPSSVRITGLSSQDGSRVMIEGLAMSNEAVNLFVNLLEKSHGIASVALLEAREQDGQGRFIVYQLSCKLGIRRGKVDNAG